MIPMIPLLQVRKPKPEALPLGLLYPELHFSASKCLTCPAAPFSEGFPFPPQLRGTMLAPVFPDGLRPGSSGPRGWVGSLIVVNFSVRAFVFSLDQNKGISGTF